MYWRRLMSPRLRWMLLPLLAAFTALCFKYSPQTPLAPAPTLTGVVQRPCEYQPQYAAQIECFWVELPGQPAEFTFAVAVFRTTAAAAADPLVFIAGGPGEGHNTSPLMLSVWDEWFARVPIRRDLVLVDLRGLAPGYPSWDCAAYAEVSRQMLQHNLSFAEEAERTQPVLQNCLVEWREQLRRHRGPVTGLDEFNSVANARDLSGVLSRLGYQEWNYLAVSYGTRVALVAALTQPQVRRIILDSPYPLDRGHLSDTAVLWAAAFTQYWQECAALQCPVDEVRFWEIMDRLRKNPDWVAVEDWQTGKKVRWMLNDGRLAAALYSAMYHSALRAEIASALEELWSGKAMTDDASLRQLLEVFYNQIFDSAFNSAVFWATECNDNRRQSEADFIAVLANLGPWQSYFAADWRYDICRAEVFHPASLPPMQTLTVPTLVAVGTLDPITTPQHAGALMQWLPQGHLLPLSGKAHAEFFADACGQLLIPWFLQATEFQISREWRGKVLGCAGG